MFYILCSMFYVSCSVFQVLCSMFHVPCSVFCDVFSLSGLYLWSTKMFGTWLGSGRRWGLPLLILAASLKWWLWSKPQHGSLHTTSTDWVFLPTVHFQYGPQMDTVSPTYRKCLECAECKIAGRTMDMEADNPTLGQILLEKVTNTFQLHFFVCKM